MARVKTLITVDDYYKNFVKKSNKLTDQNKNLFLHFVNDVMAKNPPANTFNGYCSMVFNFLEMIKIPLADLQIEDIKEYLVYGTGKKKLSDNRKNDIIGRLATLFSIANQNIVELHITEDDIKKLAISKSMIKPKNPKKPLKPYEIAKLRSLLIQAKKIRYLLSFELVYSCGLTENELALCTRKTLDVDNKCFSINGKKVILPDYLPPLLKDNLSDVFSRYNRDNLENFKTHFTEMGKDYLNRNLQLSEVTKTRSMYIIRCSICDRLYPPEASYWSIMKCIPDNENFITNSIICKNCKQARENDQI